MNASCLTGTVILQTLREHRNSLDQYSVREFALFGSIIVIAHRAAECVRL